MKPTQTVNYDLYRIPEEEVKKIILQHYHLPLTAKVEFPFFSTYSAYRPSTITIQVDR